MKTYKVTVNGSVYEVTVELTNETGFATAPAASAPAVAPADGAKVNAPLPGTILSINANVGASVKKGDVLMILEALKMENEVLKQNNEALQREIHRCGDIKSEQIFAFGGKQ